MVILSRESILKYMQRAEDPLEIYTLENGKKIPIDEGNINSHSVDLSIGSRVGYLDTTLLLEELMQLTTYDTIDTFLNGGINPFTHRDIIQRSLRVIDLEKIDRYEKRKISDGLYRVKEEGASVEFPAALVKRDEKWGVSLHPEFFFYQQYIGMFWQLLREFTDLQVEIANLLYQTNEGSFRKSRLRKNLSSLSRKLDFLKERLYTMPDLTSPSFLIFWTNEYVKMPLDLAGEIQTKSRLARIGVSGHPSSGKIDAGFHNQLALEIKNIGEIPIVFYPRDKIIEVQFETLDEPTTLGYQSRNDALYRRSTENLKV
jgi:deoxycytidine triphosphate deaminase